ncbi:MAG: glutathione S-transferase family protein [Hyphomonadaceae bacterium]|nr:glutathione S-transferase family protein [Hyphomonadaceae bacterium]
MDLTFYTNPMSRGRIVRWMLEETGADYDTVYLSYGDTMKGADYLAINPMGKVPAIKHGDTVVTECAAICAYLADAFPEANLAPPLSDRGDYYRWLFFAAGPVESATSNKAMQLSTAGHEQMSGYGDFDTMRATLIKAVSREPFLCGEQFTAADVYVGSQVGWGLQFGTILPSPELEAYRDRVYARPAFARATEIDDAAMAEHGPEMPAS